MHRLRSKLTYANVMATIAVFIALGGASYAAIKLPKNSVGAKQLKKNAVTASKIKKGAVTTAKLKDEAVTGAKVDEKTLGAVPNALARRRCGLCHQCSQRDEFQPIRHNGRNHEALRQRKS